MPQPLHQQRLNVEKALWQLSGDRALGPKSNLNDHVRGRELHVLMETTKQILAKTNDALLRKVPVAATALTLFHVCNPSNVLGPFWTPKIIFREVNFEYYWGRVKSHLQRKKSEKTQMSLFHWF